MEMADAGHHRGKLVRSDSMRFLRFALKIPVKPAEAILHQTHTAVMRHTVQLLSVHTVFQLNLCLK